MSTIPHSGRVCLAEAIKAQPLHIAWGPGDGAWSTPPAEDANATAITSEIGRRTASAYFVVADPAGTIEIPGAGTFSVSETPTNRLVVSAQFAFTDAPTATIRQAGVFVGTQVVAGLPDGQRYFTPDQLQSAGRLLQIQNRQALARTNDSRTKIDILIVF